MALTSNKLKDAKMKKLNKNIDQEIENIIQSGVSRERVQTSPFFSTRVMGRVEQLEGSNMLFNKFTFILKPALAIIILVNVFNFFVYNQSSVLTDNADSQYELVMAEYSSVTTEFMVSDDFLTVN